MNLHNLKGLFDGLMCGGAYTWQFQFSKFNFSCNVKLLQIIITTQQLMVSPDQSKGHIRRFHRFHLQLHPHPDRLQLKLFLYKSLRHFVVWNAINAQLTGHPRDAAGGK